ncbi:MULTISPECIES: hypothetical protein [Bacillus cereus group]|uniref:hypothetical protein n=1 Tax=Bacillus cereus group TaxID=86661 RepID=UPI0011559761|nr:MULTISPECIES: hypothetical protein [Bacillus cereus group]
MRKNHLKRNRWNILLASIYALACYILWTKGFIKIENINRDFHINFLTINSVFAGFLFTGLGIVASIADKDRILKLDRAGYMDNYYNAIYIGLIFHVVSIVIASLSIIVIEISDIKTLVAIEQFAMFGGVIFFIKAVCNILKIINKIRKPI